MTSRQHALNALASGDFAAAEAAAWAFDPDHRDGDGEYVRGMVCSIRGDDRSASLLLTRAAALLPDRSDITYNLGIVLRDLGDVAGARAHWESLVAREPSHADAWQSLGLLAEDHEGADQAQAIYRRAIAHSPTHAGLLFNSGELAYRQGDTALALDRYASVLSQHPGFARGYVNLGMTLVRLGRLDEAEHCYRIARRLNDPESTPIADFNLATLLLSRQRYREGFSAWEARLALPEAARPHWTLPRWTGAEPPGTRVLLWNDQGMGDAVQFLRWVPELAGRGYRIFAYMRDELKPLLSGADGIEAAAGLSDTRPDCDVELPVCSLPAALGWDGSEVALRPYLKAKADLGPVLGKVANERRIGIVWAGNPAHRNDRHRSMKLADLAPLMSVPRTRLFSLQVGQRADDLRQHAYPVIDLAPALTDFAATMTILAQLDLLITIDSAAAHVAGALGRPTWIMVPAIDPDWRWGLTGDLTPWYPSVRLFRQDRPGDWMPVVDDIVCALSAEP